MTTNPLKPVPLGPPPPAPSPLAPRWAGQDAPELEAALAELAVQKDRAEDALAWARAQGLNLTGYRAEIDRIGARRHRLANLLDEVLEHLAAARAEKAEAA